MLKFLADESCDFAIVRGLRSIGFDVRAIVEDMPGIQDSAVLKAATDENRILLTEDKDFGEWVFAHKSATSGVVLIRYPSNMRSAMVELMNGLVQRHGNELLRNSLFWNRVGLVLGVLLRNDGLCIGKSRRRI